METGKVRADLHNHFRTAIDMSPVDINYIFGLGLRRLGDGGMLGITNFNSRGAEQMFDKAKDSFEGEIATELNNALYLTRGDGQGIWLVKGQEIPTVLNDKETHVLAIGISRDIHISPNGEFQETLGEIKKLGGARVLDHPFHIWGAGHHLRGNEGLEDEILPDVDALEVHNAEAALYIPRILPFKDANNEAIKYFESIRKRFPHLGTLISSDGHSKWLEIGRNYTNLHRISPLVESSGEFSKQFIYGIRENKTYDGRMVPARFGALWHGICLKIEGHTTKDRFK
ncbi:hypothetical protein AUJ84_03010 [Candidatus Pacearchaeota archaeon CG1_02_32_132]|nr:MAG: hypothetical protein AUJ84_03010 [Candidatus Pacearchaeota archaeon CG1_02_32_132]